MAEFGGAMPYGAGAVFGTAGDQLRRKDFVGNVPLSDHVVQCIEFLRKIDAVTVAEGKSGFSISVRYRKAMEEVETSVFTVQRTMDEIQTMHETVVHWSKKHVELDARYGVKPCRYCGFFNTSQADKKWPHGLGKLFTSKAKLATELEPLMNELVAQAATERDEDNAKHPCDGVEHIPSVVTRFLLKGVDTETL